MNPNFQRALVLIEQGRWDLARKELEQVLAQEPDHAWAHALMSTSYIQADEPKDEDLHRATECAQEAIRCDPQMPYGHAAMAAVMLERNRFKESREAVDEAIRLDPDVPDFHRLAGAISFRQSRWDEALTHAERALQIDPQHTGANNLRAMALVKLGRKAEAGLTIDAALRRDPEDADSHANKGWTLLEQGRPDDAMASFKEALRLEPNHEWARRGIIEAIKARNFIYAGMLKFFLWMARFSANKQFAIIIGALVLNRVVANFGANNPEYATYCTIFLYSYFGFVLMTWVAVPLFNLILRTHPIGKYALNREETQQSTWIGLVLLSAAGLGVFAAINPGSMFWLQTIKMLCMVVPVVACFAAPPGVYRWLTLGWTMVLLGIIGFTGYLQLTINSAAGVKAWIGTYETMNAVHTYGILVTSLLISYLRGMPRPK